MRHEQEGVTTIPVAERIFVGREEPLLGSAARLLTREGMRRGREVAAGDSKMLPRVDLRGVVVALPGGRAGRRLLELLLEEAESEQLSLLPPEITTLGALPERFYQPERPAPDGLFEEMVWAEAIRGLEPKDLDRLLFPGDAVPGDAPSASSGAPGMDRDQYLDLPATLAVLQREVGAGGWSFHQVAERFADGEGFDDGERWRILSRVQDRFRRILEEHGFRDRESSRQRVLAGEEAELDRALWLVGGVDLPPVLRRFLREARRAEPHRIIIPGLETEEAGFDELGAVRPGWWREAALQVPPEAVRFVLGPREQAEATVDFLQDLDGAFGSEEISVGVPDPGIVPYLEERFQEAGAPVRYAGGRPAGSTSLVQLIRGLAGYLEERDYEAFASLLRHPAMERALLVRVERTAHRTGSFLALADRYHAHHLPAHLEEKRIPSGGERERDRLAPGIRALREVLDELLEPLAGDPVKWPLSEWAHPVEEVLAEVYGDLALDRASPIDREVIETAKALQGVLAEMVRLPRALDPPVPAVMALRTILSRLQGVRIPRPQGDGAIELLGWLELALDDAPVMVVTGANEPFLPEAVNADAFLPHDLRSRLGLLDNRGRWARDALHLRMVLEGRPHVRLLSGRADGEGNPLRPSRFLLMGSPREVATRLRAALNGGGQPGAPSGPDEGHPSTGDGFGLPPEPVLSAREPLGRLRVTDFRKLLEDPYLFALERVLKLDTVDDQAREMDGGLFGTVAHAVLEEWGRGETHHSRDARVLREALHAILDRQVSDRFGDRPLPAVRLQVEQLRLRLSAVAEAQAKHAAAGWELRMVEASAGREGVAFEVDGEEFRLLGRIDRVDYNPATGEWMVLDYKTGESVQKPDAAHRKGREGSKEWKDLQLPLYRHLVGPALAAMGSGAGGAPDAAEAGEGAKAAQAPRILMGYFAIPRDSDKVEPLVADWSPEELAEADEAAREVIRELRRNHFAFRPGITKPWRGSPLGPLVGAGVLAASDDEEDGEEMEP